MYSFNSLLHFSVALTIIYTTERGNHLNHPHCYPVPKELGDTYFGPKGRLIYDWAYLNPALFSDKNPLIPRYIGIINDLVDSVKSKYITIEIS